MRHKRQKEACILPRTRVGIDYSNRYFGACLDGAEIIIQNQYTYCKLLLHSNQYTIILA